VVNADSQLLRAVKNNAAVLTIDEPLKRKLIKAGITTIYLRGTTRREEKG
jgi:rRNA-processing protein FCF1